MSIFKIHRRLQRRKVAPKRLVIGYVIALFFILGMMLAPIIAHGIQGYDHYLYFAFTGETVGIEWDAGTGADRYEWRLRHVQNDAILVQGQTSQTSISVFFPRIGIYQVEIRSVKDSDPVQYSDWVVSTDDQVAQVDGQAKGWWVSTWIAPAGGIEIE